MPKDSHSSRSSSSSHSHSSHSDKRMYPSEGPGHGHGGHGGGHGGFRGGRGEDGHYHGRRGHRCKSPPPPGFWSDFCQQELGEESMQFKKPYKVQSLGKLDPPPKRPQKEEVMALLEGAEINAVKPYETEEAKEEGVGEVRALLIGINYYGTANELSGCVNDVKQELATFEKVKIPIDEMIILVDDESFPNVTDKPTHNNILKYMAWLVQDVKAGDVLFMHYSGHGAQVASQNDAEEDDDECICPSDFSTAGVIIDDDIFKILAKDLPEGVRLTVIFDCCHSGSMMDLPYQFAADSEVSTNQKFHMQQVRKENDSKGDIIMISGCEDTQTSADVSNAASLGNGVSGAGGAATQCLTHILLNNQGLSWQETMVETREYMKEKGFDQVPQLSASKPIDLADNFSLSKTFAEDDEVRQEQANGDGFYYGGHGGARARDMGPGRGRWGGGGGGGRGRGGDRGGRGGQAGAQINTRDINSGGADEFGGRGGRGGGGRGGEFGGGRGGEFGGRGGRGGRGPERRGGRYF